MKFRELMLRAKTGEQEAIHEIIQMYNPLLLKESIVLGIFDEDLYQELCLTVMHCIDKFRL